MKQILQNLASGETQVVTLPCPGPAENMLLINSRCSLVSVGTERSLVDFGNAGLLGKALRQPDKVRLALDKARADGVVSAYESVTSKLDRPMPLGYSNVGIVSDNGGTSFTVGDRVVSNGHHAEVVRVPHRLCARIPDTVSDQCAAFTVPAAIALQGIRLARPTLGEAVVVTGLGLIGQLAVQLLRAQGCRVLGIDLDSRRCELARTFGAEVVDLSRGEDPLAAARAFSRGRGVDAVLITATSESDKPVREAAAMCRQRGRIVLVGVVGLKLSRGDFYQKELSFQVSCSYGPGRYDPEYEERGHDYPLGFVRWTEQRNFEAVLDLMAGGALAVESLISHRFPIDSAAQAYTMLDEPATLGVLIAYPDNDRTRMARTVTLTTSDMGSHEEILCSFVGGGNYASRVLIPAFRSAGARLATLVTDGGVSALHQGGKHGFARASTDFEAALAEEAVNTMVIATRHHLHAGQTVAALQAGKQVFVEKPLALSIDELEAVDAAWQAQAGRSRLMVGFNRRFSPLTVTMKALLDKVAGPKTFILTMNAGHIPAEHWVQDRATGGGRIIGEACHYIDLLRFLVGSPISDFSAASIGSTPADATCEDKATITLRFEDGSLGTVHYFANGGRAFAKERIEAFAADGVLQLDNFKRLNGYGWKGFRSQRLLSKDKGQSACVAAFLQSVRSGEACPIPHEELMEVARVSIEVAQALRR